MDNIEINRTSNWSFRRSAGSFLAGLPPHDEFEKLLECPVCQDLPLPPIYTCQTGHTICIKCKVQLKECPLCRMSYTTSRNFLLESIVLTSTYYCSHRDKGCDVTGSTLKLKSHHETCTFRPTKCFLAGRDDCNGESATVFLSEYLDHLTDLHELKRAPFADGKLNIFRLGFSFRNWEHVVWNKDPTCYWNSSWFIFDEKIFVTRTYSRGPKFFFKVAAIAEPSDAAKYSIKVTIEKAYKQFPKYELTTLVPSIRVYHENIKLIDVAEYGAVSKDLLEELGQLIAMPDKSKFKLSWKVRYELSRVQ